MRPTKQHYLRVSAELEHSAEAESLEGASEYEKMLFLLARHQKNLKGVQSMEQRATMKREYLADYLPWIEGALAAGTGKQDNVLMTWLVWAIDCAEYPLALRIAEYALHQDLVLPEQFSRTVPTLVAEEFSDAAKKAFQLQGAPFDVNLLQRVAELTADKDMPDQSRARLYREIGLQLKDTDQAAALAALEKAWALDDKIGVKTEVNRLRKALGKAEMEEAKENDGEAKTEEQKDDGEVQTDNINT